MPYLFSLLSRQDLRQPRGRCFLKGTVGVTGHARPCPVQVTHAPGQVALSVGGLEAIFQIWS